jgi:hypothetical protein
MVPFLLLRLHDNVNPLHLLERDIRTVEVLGGVANIGERDFNLYHKITKPA